MIGWYVHHHGDGHLRRLEAVAAHLDTHVTGLGSGHPPRDGAPFSWVSLTRDDSGGTVQDPTAGGALHWAPVGDDGLRHRMATIAAWADVADCRLFVVDGSVEVALLARLLGLPTVLLAQRGHREDRPHHLAMDTAGAIIAPWTQRTQPRWPSRWLAKTHWTGSFSRFDGRDPAEGDDVACDHDRCVVVVLGTGGHVLSADDMAAAADATPDWHWHVVGRLADPGHERVTPHGVVDDPWPLLCHATVVAGPAGSGVVGEVAAAGARFVALPQPRPFREQEERADRLAEEGLVVRGPSRPKPDQWPGLLDGALALDLDHLLDYHDQRGAARAAHVLEGLAHGGPRPQAPDHPAASPDEALADLRRRTTPA